MSNKPYKLYALITSRDRTRSTEHCIRSLKDTCEVFEEFEISLMDNLTGRYKSRQEMIDRLFLDEYITYYSQDTKTSTQNCFPKPYLHERWRLMVNQTINIRKAEGVFDPDREFFVLIDNDMLFGDGWDKYFISAFTQVKPIHKDIQFAVKSPGGVVSRARELGSTFKIPNLFSQDEGFDVNVASFGGGSGFWFMNYETFNNINWEPQEFVNIFKNHYKKHDTTMWAKLIHRYKGNPYVLGVIPPDPENPLVLHLGGVTGSLCNVLVSKRYGDDVELRYQADKQLEKHTHRELFEKYKHTCKEW